MITHNNKIYIMLILVILISACGLATTSDQVKENSFSSLFPNCEMNSKIAFLPPQPNYKFDQYISLDYQNLSENQIIFPPDSGVRIFVYQETNSNWLELNNNMQYSASPEPYLILEPGDNLTSYRNLVISPEISDLDNTVTEIRVAITGHIFQYEKASDDCVGAFIDIQP